MELFGFKIIKNKEEQPTPIIKVDGDAASIIDSGGAYSAYTNGITFDVNSSNKKDLITQYRQMANHSEVDYAIDEIINEMVSTEKNADIIDINLDEIDFSDKIKKSIINEFNQILTLLNFNNDCYEICRRWYEDGHLYYQVLIDNESPRNGIQELIYIDPRLIDKVKEVKTSKDKTSFLYQKTKEEYFVYSQDGMLNSSQNGVVKLTSDAVVYVNSGILNHNNSTVLSHLHKAIIPLNQLKALEDSTVIYKIARAPERRVFYIDVGNLPPSKASEHLNAIATNYKNKITYNPSTGEVNDHRQFMSMTQDYFLPRRSDGKATEITTLSGGQGLGEMEEVNYHLNKLRRSLNIPVSRFEQGSGFSLGRQSEISRDEVKFTKFINRLRKKFNKLFIELLRRQLILKNVISESDFEVIKNNISFQYTSANIFSEAKEQELLSQRIDILDRVQPYIGVHFSQNYVKRKILMLSDEDINQLNEQIDKEKKESPQEDEN